MIDEDGARLLLLTMNDLAGAKQLALAVHSMNPPSLLARITAELERNQPLPTEALVAINRGMRLLDLMGAIYQEVEDWTKEAYAQEGDGEEGEGPAGGPEVAGNPSATGAVQAGKGRRKVPAARQAAPRRRGV